MTGYRIIYACPDCGGDLEDEGLTLWCPACETSVTYAALAADDGGDDDPRD